MKARFKGKNTKKITIAGETISFPSGEWVILPTIAFYNKLKNLEAFDLVTEYDITPFLKYQNKIRFGSKTISCDHKPTIRALDKMKILSRQAYLPEEKTVIYRVITFSPLYLEGFISMQDQVQILCKRTKGGIGDIIMTTPAIEAICKKYPDYVVDYSCPDEYLPLLENNPYIRSLIRLADVNEDSYDLVYDMSRVCIQYEGKTQPNVDLNRTEIFAKVVGIEPEQLPRTKFYLSNEEIETGIYVDYVKSAQEQALVKRQHPSNDRLVIGLCLDSSAGVRSYYYGEQLVSQVSEKWPDAIILFFSQGDFSWIKHHNVYPFNGLSLREVAVLISSCDLFFGPDTGLTHIAAALRIQTSWFFTHIKGEIRTRGYDTSEIVQETPPSCPQSAPCWYLFPCDPSQLRGEKLDAAQCVISIYPEIICEHLGGISQFPSLSILILCHNKFELTLECVNKLLDVKKFNDELILIDNGSTDQTQSYFSALKAEKFYYHRNDENIGCVSGRNQGLGLCLGRFVWMLDNDQFVQHYSLEHIRRTEGDFVGVEGLYIKEDGLATLYSKCGMFNYIGAGGMFCGNHEINQLGGFDDNYNPAWFEDPDICFKATEAGYKLGLCETANIEHRPHSTNHSQSNFDSSEIWQRNRDYFVKKWEHLRIGCPIVSIVILTHNDSDTTIRCLKSIYQNTELNQFEVIVVDNGSNAKEVSKLVHYEKSNLLYIFNSDNLMVAAGRNIGAKKSNGEYILFLDNDMLVPDGWLNKILTNMESKNAIATAPRVVDINDRGERVRFCGTVVKDGKIHELEGDGAHTCDFLPGGALFVSKQAFAEVPFDEKFIFGVEDYDWCMKMRQRGYALVNTPSVTFLHAKPTRERTVTPYDDEERARKGSSFIEDSIRLFLFRYHKELPNQWKQSGWLQWAMGKNNQKNVTSKPELMMLIENEVGKLYPDEII